MWPFFILAHKVSHLSECNGTGPSWYFTFDPGKIPYILKNIVLKSKLLSEKCKSGKLPVDSCADYLHIQTLSLVDLLSQ